MAHLLDSFAFLDLQFNAFPSPHRLALFVFAQKDG
jgi:hypothetical protein